MLTRRAFTASALAVPWVSSGCATIERPARAVAAVEETFHAAFAPYQLALTRLASLERARAAGRPGLNHLVHRNGLSDHTHRAVTTPNNDTLYSAAWLDLRSGPVGLTVPAVSDRYLSVALLDIYTDNFAVLGRRALADAAGPLAIIGPNWRGPLPVGHVPIRAPTNDVWMIVRVLVDGPNDLDAARAVQAQVSFSFTPQTAADEPAGPPDQGPAPARFLDIANQLIGRSPTPPRLQERPSLWRAGLRPGEAAVWNQLEPAFKEAWTTQFPTLNATLRGGIEAAGDVVDGWSYPRPGMGRFGDDELYRARVAMTGLGALPEEEALYLTASTDSQGRALDGRHAYRLTLPPALPPCAFWSLSMYEVADDGRLFFSQNPLNRYAIGNRTAGLSASAEGLALQFSHSPPAGGASNWLPAPLGPMRLTFRVYEPSQPWRTGQFRLPPITRV